VQERQARITELDSRVAKQEAVIAQQQKDFASKLAQQQKQIEALTLSVQQVSAYIAVSKPAAKMVANGEGVEIPAPRENKVPANHTN
jgi:uncharacterized coiled-coil protein SlyX